MSTRSLDRTSSFETSRPGVGTFRLRPLVIPEDMPVVHDWVHRPYAAFWGLTGKSLDEVELAYREITRAPHVRAQLGLHDERPSFLVESYLPFEDPIARHYDARPSDRGMHVLVAPPTAIIRDFTWHVFTTVMDALFDDPEVERVVVEPDVRNEKIHALNRRAGFEYQRTIALPATATTPAKTAYLAFCTRAHYTRALRHGEAR